MIKDVLIGVAITWLTLTPEGKKMRKQAVAKLADAYLLPKKEVKKEEVKADDDAPIA